MKDIIRISIVTSLFCIIITHHAHLQSQPKQPNQTFNSLTKVEVSKLQFSTHIMFDFASPIYFKKKIIKEKLQFLLAFPGMKREHFNEQLVLEKLSILKEEGMVTAISITEQNDKVPMVILTLSFAATKRENNMTNTIETANSLLIKWTKIEDPHRLILDIFTKESLDTLKKRDAIILHAHNDVIKSDSQPSISSKISKKKKSKNGLRVAVDAGHGGPVDCGARGFHNLLEKNVTLDLAKRVRTILNGDGFQTLLTRETDQAMSLQDRSDLASQLKADFFVSIHVNSCGKLGGQASGVETFYLQEKKLLPPTRKGGFIFVNLEKDLDVIKTIDGYHKNNINTSKKLATSIQTNLLELLKNQNMPTNNRGIKPAFFRVLFRNEIPSVLVEVAFITNKNDCDKLIESSYRQHLAMGICNGIKKFAETYQK